LSAAVIAANITSRSSLSEITNYLLFALGCGLYKAAIHAGIETGRLDSGEFSEIAKW
jgi:hypothetical protein